MTYDVVVPTVGRPSLDALLAGLASGEGPLPESVVLVDDRRAAATPMRAHVPAALAGRVIVVRGGGRGPAAARNAGARRCAAEWVAFLDDDVVPPPGWRAALAVDVADAGDAAATQGRVRVPLEDAAATDWQRSVKQLETSTWITADMAYRRDAFAGAGGFDERFPRAYREDTDLGLRVVGRGGRIVRGTRFVDHPAGAAPWWKSVSRQRGNADDALMLFLHGPGWQSRAAAPRGMRRRHLLTTALFAAGMFLRLSGRRATGAAMLGGWAALTADLARRRITHGSSRSESFATAATSIAIPFAATWWWVAGLVRAWRLTRPPDAVLFDRDGTLIEDVPYNGDPGLVTLRPGARQAVERLRASGVRLGMVSNQSGVARGLVTEEQVRSVNARIEELIGPLDATVICMHAPGDGCACRKPRPGLLLEAARRLGVRPARCAVIGDIESDVEAARSAGARGVMVPTPATRPEEVERAREVADDLGQAVDRLLRRAW